jgi:hypothetical protein
LAGLLPINAMHIAASVFVNGEFDGRRKSGHW